MKSKIVALVLCLFLITISANYFLAPIESFEYAVSVDVTSKEKEVGFDATNKSFAFGILPRGAGAVRQFDIETSAKRRVHVGISGEIKRWLSPSKNNFVLLGKETLDLGIKIPENAAPGHHEGKIVIKTYKTF